MSTTADRSGADSKRAGPVIDAWRGRDGRAVVFDFNGTLSDDEPILLRIFTDLFAETFGWELTDADYATRMAGRSDREIVQIVVDEQAGGDVAVTDELLALRRDRYRELVRERSPILAGTAALVRVLAEQGVPLAIVTGAQRPDVELVLETSGLRELFSVVVTEEDVAVGKPDPEGFVRAAAELGVDPADVLVFEDSVAGVRGAKAAGMACIGVTGTVDPAALGSVADAVIDRLDPSLLDHRGQAGPA